MRKINAVILCASAMSSSMIVEALRKEAPKKGIDLTVSCSASLRYRTFDFSGLDIVMIAPQVKGQMKDIQKFAAEKGYPDLPFMLIPMREYGLAKGEALIDGMLEMLDKDK
jgi:Phosphotransferase system cellobiose-specific component IIB